MVVQRDKVVFMRTMKLRTPHSSSAFVLRTAYARLSLVPGNFRANFPCEENAHRRFFQTSAHGIQHQVGISIHGERESRRCSFAPGFGLGSIYRTPVIFEYPFHGSSCAHSAQVIVDINGCKSRPLRLARNRAPWQVIEMEQSYLGDSVSGCLVCEIIIHGQHSPPW